MALIEDNKFHVFDTLAEWEVAQEEFDGDEISFIVETEEIKWGKLPPIKALKFTATGASTLAFGTENEISFEKSSDGKTWENWDFSAISLADGESVYIRGNNPNGLNPDYNGAKFVMTGSIACEGNIMHLLDYTQDLAEIPANNCFKYLFWHCASLTSAPELPATELKTGCYTSLFEGCTSLENAPELPAITVDINSYANMFEGCTSLENAPELPATTLAESCYEGMFKGCTSLVTAPELPATTLVENCYCSMFQGCTSLVTAPELPVTTLAVRCYDYMFDGCTSLTSAPELPATTLADYCYTCIFRGCSKINEVTILATDISASDAIKDWLKDTAASGVIKCDASMVATFEADANTPAGWTVEALTVKCYKLINEDTPYYFKVMPIPGGNPRPLFSDENCTINVGGVQYIPLSGGTYVCNLSDGSSFSTTEIETIYN